MLERSDRATLETVAVDLEALSEKVADDAEKEGVLFGDQPAPPPDDLVIDVDDEGLSIIDAVLAAVGAVPGEWRLDAVYVLTDLVDALLEDLD
jgi:hypothetical protein